MTSLNNIGDAGSTPRLGAKGAALLSGQRDLRPIRRLAPFIFRYRWRLGLTLAFLLISSLSSLAIPALAGRIIDKGFLEKNLDAVAQYGIIAILVAAVMAAASAGRFYFISILGERVLTDLRRSVFDHLLTLDATFFDLHRVGELTSRLNGDVATIRGAVGSSLSMMLRGLVTLIGAVILMFLTSPYLALTIVVVGPLVVLPVVLFARRLRRMSRRTQDAMAEMSAMATEALGATKTIKSFVQEPEQSRLYGRRAEDSFRAEVTRLGTRARAARRHDVPRDGGARGARLVGLEGRVRRHGHGGRAGAVHDLRADGEQRADQPLRDHGHAADRVGGDRAAGGDPRYRAGDQGAGASGGAAGAAARRRSPSRT